MLKCLKNGKTDNFGRCILEQLYLKFEKLKISRQWGTEWLKTKKHSATDVFQCYKATSHVRVMFFKVEMRKVRSGWFV